MKNKLKEITIEEVSRILPNKEDLRRLQGETFLKIENGEFGKEKKIDPILDLEITLQKCKRIGFFDK